MEHVIAVPVPHVVHVPALMTKDELVHVPVVLMQVSLKHRSIEVTVDAHVPMVVEKVLHEPRAVLREYTQHPTWNTFDIPVPHGNDMPVRMIQAELGHIPVVQQQVGSSMLVSSRLWTCPGI